MKAIIIRRIHISMKYILTILCLVIHTIIHPTYQVIDVNICPINFSEGTTYIVRLPNHKTQKICTVSTILEVEDHEDKAFPEAHTAIYLRNHDANDFDCIIRQNTSRILGYHHLDEQEGLQKKFRTDLYDARIKQFNARKDKIGQAFPILGTTYILEGIQQSEDGLFGSAFYKKSGLLYDYWFHQATLKSQLTSETSEGVSKTFRRKTLIGISLAVLYALIFMRALKK